MNELFKQVFTHNERERNVNAIRHFCGPETLDYIRALEDVARMAVDYADNSTPSNAVRLDNALAVVDRMKV